MKIMRYMLGALLALAIVGCEHIIEIKSYPKIEDLSETSWYSHDQVNNIFYDITYGANNEGIMLGYSEQGRVNEVVNRSFSYTFTPATESLDAIVKVDFEDGQHYGGILIHKGFFQINLIDVYLIQLYETDAEGEIIYNADGTMKSTILMWKE